MEKLFESLNQIVELLNQIYTITGNQTTILLDSKQAGEGLDMIEQMAVYKNELTTQLESTEQIFQQYYDQYKNHITDIDAQKLLKQTVSYVLELKDKVIKLESQNVLIMQDLLKRLTEKVEIPKQAQAVSAAYKQHSKNNFK